MASQIMQSIRRQASTVLTTGQRFKTFDQIRNRHMWSTYLFTPDANGYISSGDYDVFTTPPGQVGQGFAVPLTLLETNWNSANRIPDNQNFVIHELGCMLRPVPKVLHSDDPLYDAVTFGAYANACLWDTILSIQYLTNAIPLGYCGDFAQAAGAQMGTYVPYAPAAEEETRVPGWYNTNGFAAPGLRRRFKVPILLQHGETFSFRFSVPRAYFSDDWSFYLRLDFWATESFVEKS